MKNLLEQGGGVSAEIKKESVIGDFDSFMTSLVQRAKEATPAKVETLLRDLEKYAQTTERKIEVYTSPKLETFCCGQVSSKTVSSEGEIVDDPNRKTYLIGVPFIFVAGEAPRRFLLGEIEHEQGHAKFTDFGRMKRFKILAENEGYDPKDLSLLDNCLEDPRMERLVGGPMHENQRGLLFEKNRLMIMPNIAKGLSTSHPVEQLKFLIKLERLWAIHGKDLGSEKKLWDNESLNPRVREEYEKLKPLIARVTGDANKPPMKINAEVEKIIVDEIWPALKRLIDEFPREKKNGEEKGEGKGEGEEEGEPIDDPEKPPLDPNNPNSWPPEMQKFFKEMEEKHKKRLEKEAKEKKEENERKKQNAEKISNKEHELLKSKDEFDNPEMRERYNEIKREVSPAITKLKRIFQRFLPKVDEPQYEWGKRGIRFDSRRYARQAGTGHETPLGRRKTPEKNALLLQILVDVSGSMEQGNRIENAIKACVAICEAAKDHNIMIEILANDDDNVATEERFKIKGFGESFRGKVQSRIVSMKENFCNAGNEDADAIRAAIPRLKNMLQRSRNQFDRVSSLMLYISDSTTQSAETQQAANEARRLSPFEGTAITSEGEIPAMVKFHFGPDSVVPKDIDEFPDVIQQILQRHITKLKPKE